MSLLVEMKGEGLAQIDERIRQLHAHSAAWTAEDSKFGQAHRDGAGARDPYATARRMVLNERSRRARSASAAAARHPRPFDPHFSRRELEEIEARGREFFARHGRPREEV